ncbi:YfhO family protein [soil metagenome]
MAKSQSKTGNRSLSTVSGKAASGFKDEKDFNLGKAENWIYIGIIIVTLLMFFREGIFSGKVFTSGDHIAFDSFKTFFDDAKKAGMFALWTPYIFMGMPNFAGLIGFSPRTYDLFGNLFGVIYDMITGSQSNPVFSIVLYYFIFGTGLYFYSNYKFKNKLISLFVALSGVFATDLIQRLVVGHNTKVLAITFFPLILLVVDKLIDQNYKNKFYLLLDSVLLIIMLHIQLGSNHMQMIFYSYLMLGMYVLYILIYRVLKKENVRGALTAGIIFIAAAVISIAMNADIMMSVKEYNKYSIRGASSIASEVDSKISKDTPLDYDYATRWSFSPGETLTFFLPYYYGFGDVDYQGQKVNLYWGQMPFTTSPVYFGVIVLFLGLIGMIMNFRRNLTVQALTVITIFFLLLSFGRNFTVIYNLFFYYFPFFSSFRAPVMIHNFIDLMFAILAGYGIKSIIDSTRDTERAQFFKKVNFGLMGFCGLLFIISIVGFEGSYKDSVVNGPKAQEYKQQGASPQQINQAFTQRASIAYENVISDMRIHSIMVLIVLALAYYYTQRKISMKIFIIGAIIISFIDLWNINNKTIHWDDKKQTDAVFDETDYTNFILKSDPDTYTYRVAEMQDNQPATTNNYAFYRLQQFNGYQGAKIRIYQDALDVVGGANPLLLGLGNVKYVLSSAPLKDTAYSPVFKGSKMQVYENKAFLPRAYFVNEVKVEKPYTILLNIKQSNFNPKQTAFLESEINKPIEKPDSSSSIKLLKADIHSYEYDVNTSGNNLMVMSDIYYPAGWKAFIDGAETEIYKTDYLFRSIIVPKGKHKIEVKFEPKTYYTGKTISLTANIFVILLLIGGIGGVVISRKKPVDLTTGEPVNNENEKEKH